MSKNINIINSIARVNVHRLACGLTVITTSPKHGTKFSDGTESPAQDKEVCDLLTCDRVTTDRGEFAPGIGKVELRMILNSKGQEALRLLCERADIVLIPFPVLTALREQGIRAEFPNAVAAIATKETERSSPQEKIWDVTKWSW